jgi:fructose/tagatose bisphosphate aldolase
MGANGMIAADPAEVLAAAKGAVETSGDGVKVRDWAPIRGALTDRLAWTAAFSKSEAARAQAAWLVRALAREAGNGPASIHAVYLARGRGQLPSTFTVPAINIRPFAYFFARAIFRAAKKHQAGAIICELSRSEMGYTHQTPQEYATSVLAAALREDYPFPVFIQGDHFQVNAKEFAKDPKASIDGVKKLSAQAIEAGFYNIDIDTSTLVDLSKTGLDAQQEQNYLQCAILTEYIRSIQPKDLEVSLGGEIGEVGGKNSTVEELDAFMAGYAKRLKEGLAGISKISVQTGTSHGGVVLPDGTIAKVKVDFDTLAKLSRVARTKYGLGGAVQHGASTLPVELFDAFPQSETCEIHLATEFQNILYEHPEFPATLKAEMYAYLDKECAAERKDGETDAQFYYKTRKKALGPFKERLWGLPDGLREVLMGALQDKVDLLIRKLGVAGTGPIIKPHVLVASEPPRPPHEAAAAHAERFEGDD